MYSFPYFKENNKDVVLEFMRQHPFAMVIGCDDNKPVATQLPFLIDVEDEKIILISHLMRNTDHHAAFENNKNVLVVFTGADTYVSASLYTNQQTASTWNYLSVHARGKMEFTGKEELLDILKRTTDHFENSAASPASYDNLPADYVNRLCNAIVGIRIEVSSLDNVFKLSQNRDKESYRNITNALSERDADAKTIADEMKKREGELFKKQT